MGWAGCRSFLIGSIARAKNDTQSNSNADNNHGGKDPDHHFALASFVFLGAWGISHSDDGSCAVVFDITYIPSHPSPAAACIDDDAMLINPVLNVVLTKMSPAWFESASGILATAAAFRSGTIPYHTPNKLASRKSPSHI